MFFLFAYLSALSTFAPLLIGLKHWRYLSWDLKLAFILSGVSILSDSISFVLVRNGVNTWPIGNLFLIVQFVLLFFVFDFHFHNKSKWWWRIAFTGLVIFTIINYIALESPNHFNTHSTYLGGIFMIVIASRYLYQLLRDLPVEKIHDYPMLWVSFAVLIYFAGTLFLFLFNNYLMAHQPVNHQAIWILHNLLNLTKNGFLAIALWKNYRLRISSV